MNRRRSLFKYLAFFLFLIGVSLVDAQVTPGQFVVEPATLTSLGFEWYIGPNDDPLRHAYVTVQYKKPSDPTWKQGMNLLRIQNEVNAQAPGIGTYTAPNMFAGSVLDLEANTMYEVSLTMHDPDGVNGLPIQKAVVVTRPQPQPYAGETSTTRTRPTGWGRNLRRTL